MALAEQEVKAFHMDLRDQADWSLVSQVQAGDDDAFADLLSRWRYWIRRVAWRWNGLPGVDEDDVAQTAAVALWEAARRFRPHTGVPFRAFARRVIERRVTDFAKSLYRAKHQVLRDAILLDPFHTSEDPWAVDVTHNPEQIVAERDGYRERLSALVQQLSRRERQVLGCLLQGMAPAEGHRRLGMPYKTYDNARQRIYRKAQHVWPDVAAWMKRHGHRVERRPVHATSS